MTFVKIGLGHPSSLGARFDNAVQRACNALNDCMNEFLQIAHSRGRLGLDNLS
jgi:hypothetical protein